MHGNYYYKEPTRGSRGLGGGGGGGAGSFEGRVGCPGTRRGGGCARGGFGGERGRGEARTQAPGIPEVLSTPTSAGACGEGCGGGGHREVGAFDESAWDGYRETQPINKYLPSPPPRASTFSPSLRKSASTSALALDNYRARRSALEQRTLALDQTARSMAEVKLYSRHHHSHRRYICVYFEFDSQRVAREESELAKRQRQRDTAEDLQFYRYYQLFQRDKDAVIDAFVDRLEEEDNREALRDEARLSMVKEVMRDNAIEEVDDTVGLPRHGGTLGYTEAIIQGQLFKALLDGGSMICIMREDVRQRLRIPTRTANMTVRMAGGSLEYALGISDNVKIIVGGVKTRVHFIIFRGGSNKILLGQNFMRQVEATFHYKHDGSVIFGLSDDNGDSEAVIEVTPKDNGPQTSDQQI
ncbi:hypothetical protein P7C70_g737, partial [Phenoliferia sp. Uapishka_3]